MSENLLPQRHSLPWLQGARRPGPLAKRADWRSPFLTPLVALFLLLLLSSCQAPSQAPLGKDACDRACLIELTDNYVSSLVGDGALAGMLARNARLVENMQPREPEQSAWQAGLQGQISFGVHVPDPERNQSGWMGVINNADKPVILAVRLQFHNRKIVEAEHLYADLADVSQDDLATIFPAIQSDIPMQDRKATDDLERIGASYYNALDGNDGSLSPFSDACQRLENGVLTAGDGTTNPNEFDPYRPGIATDCRSQIDSQAFVFIDKIEDRRVVAADRQTGLVMGFSRFRHSMENLPYKVALQDGSTIEVSRQTLPYEPFDLVAAHIFKIGAEGTITSISAVGVLAPYGTPSAWD